MQKHMRFYKRTKIVFLGVSLAAAGYAQAPTITSFNPQLSAAGSPVYIAGTNFTGATSVTFDGKKAPFLVDSPESIIALVPLAASTGTVKVVTPSGTATTSQPYDIVSASWDALQGFSATANPDGAWTLGSEPSLGGIFTPFTIEAACFTNGPCWFNGGTYPNAVAVALNTSPYTEQYLTIIVPDNMLYLAAEANVAVVRWTAPASGKYWIFGQFQGLDLNLPNVTVAIYENQTTVLFTNSLTFFGDYQNFNVSGLTLKKGATIDFVSTSTDVSNDNVGLMATVDQIK
ncbi:MAG: IPT/TIG domain-containing protein [Bryobacteraceae bacterium]|jgi:hypothetical protein